MNSPSPARASSARRASAKPTASKPQARARSRLGDPQAGRRLAGLIEDIDRDAATRIPIAADPQPRRSEGIDQPARDRQRAVLMECRVVPERAEIQLQRLAFE